MAKISEARLLELEKPFIMEGTKPLHFLEMRELIAGYRAWLETPGFLRRESLSSEEFLATKIEQRDFSEGPYL